MCGFDHFVGVILVKSSVSVLSCNMCWGCLSLTGWPTSVFRLILDMYTANCQQSWSFLTCIGKRYVRFIHAIRLYIVIYSLFKAVKWQGDLCSCIRAVAKSSTEMTLCWKSVPHPTGTHVWEHPQIYHFQQFENWTLYVVLLLLIYSSMMSFSGNLGLMSTIFLKKTGQTLGPTSSAMCQYLNSSL